MRRAKISIVGAGHVGETTAELAALKGLGDIVLLDIPQTGDMPAGKALDLFESSPIARVDCRIVGSTSYDDTAGSDVVVITAGVPRKPGMSRDDLLDVNTTIVRTIAEQAARLSPEAVLIVVTNPLDAMVHVAWKASRLPTRRVVGQAGILDTARFRAFLSMELNVSVEDISTLLLGGHGDAMVPLPRCTSVSGIPITQLVSKERLEALVERTRKGGGEIVKLLQTGSAYHAPGAAVTEMIDAIVRDRKRVLPCAAYCDSEYGVGGCFVGVPVVLGSGGVERIIEVDLDASERSAFETSVAGVKALVSRIAA
jgi:malate dehydrogenase